MQGEDAVTDTVPEGRVGFRDIYRAVGESEVRITAAIRDAVAPISAKQEDHEVRLRAIEVGDVKWLRERDRSREEQGRRIGSLESGKQADHDSLESAILANKEAIRTFADREHGIFITLSASKQLLLVLFGSVGFLLGIATLLSLVAQ